MTGTRLRRLTPVFQPTHFTALFDATRYSAALRRYAMLTGAFERAKQEDARDRFRVTSPQYVQNFHEQARRASESMQESRQRLVAAVERLGGRITYPFPGDLDYCEVHGLSEAQAKEIFKGVFRD